MRTDREAIEPIECAWEERTAAAASAETADGMPHEHLAECERCRAVAALVRALAQEGRAEVLRAGAHVPDAAALFALAGADARPQRAPSPRWNPGLVARVLRPLVWIERIAIALASLAFFAIMRWAPPGGAATPLDTVVAPLEPATTAPPADPASVIVTLTAVLIVAIAAYGLVGMSNLRPCGWLLVRSR